MSNNSIVTIFILGGVGLAGYFIYEDYMKKNGYTPLLSNNGGFFQSAANSVNNFLSQISGNTPSDLLNSSGGLNTAGQTEANSILSNPLSFNDLMMQSQFNNILNGTGLSGGSNSISNNTGSSVFIPFPGVTPGITPTFGLGIT